MKNEFKFSINDMGIINTAEINIGSINVIGGKNASGKSISSKLLFCFLTSLSNHGNYIDNNAVKELYLSLISYCKKYYLSSPNKNNSFEEETDNLMRIWDDENISYGYFKEFNDEFKKIIEEYELNDYPIVKSSCDDILKIIDIHENPFEHFKHIAQTLINMEFGQSELKKFNGAKINFEARYNNTQMEYQLAINDSCEINILSDKVPSLLEGNILYLDSPSTLDFNIGISTNIMEKPVLTNKTYHNDYLLRCLINQKNEKLNNNPFIDVIDEKKKIFNSLLSNLISGNFEFNHSQNQFNYHHQNDIFEVQNTASGYKQLGILQLLLNNGYLNTNSILIIDEPEINLHPYFQIKYMEILVKMVKTMGVKLYINSHSPFIIEALEVYSKKEKLEDETFFYLCKEEEDNPTFNIKEVQKEDFDEIYKNLSKPYDIINDIRFENEWEDEIF